MGRKLGDECDKLMIANWKINIQVRCDEIVWKDRLIEDDM